MLTVELSDAFTESDAERLIDSLRLFGIGASWGGFESLVIPVNLASRAVPDSIPRGPMLRLHVGLEDPEDLIADLECGLSALTQPQPLRSLRIS
ncbi:Cystathionine beta-lyase [compost metagenome]